MAGLEERDRKEGRKEGEEGREDGQKAGRQKGGKEGRKEDSNLDDGLVPCNFEDLATPRFALVVKVVIDGSEARSYNGKQGHVSTVRKRGGWEGNEGKGGQRGKMTGKQRHRTFGGGRCAHIGEGQVDNLGELGEADIFENDQRPVHTRDGAVVLERGKAKWGGDKNRLPAKKESKTTTGVHLFEVEVRKTNEEERRGAEHEGEK
jgi:hypothetical protein